MASRYFQATSYIIHLNGVAVVFVVFVVGGGGGGVVVVVSIMNKIDLQQGGNYDGILFASGLLQTVIYR